MMDLLLLMLIFGVGMATGAVMSLAKHQARPERDPPKAHHGLYGSPPLAHYFRMRALETDPYWARMPLKEYAEKKQRFIEGDTQ